MKSSTTFSWFCMVNLTDLSEKEQVIKYEKDGVTFEQLHKSKNPNGHGSLSYTKKYILKTYHPRLDKNGPIEKEMFFMHKHKQYGEEVTIVGKPFDNKPNWSESFRLEVPTRIC